MSSHDNQLGADQRTLKQLRTAHAEAQGRRMRAMHALIDAGMGQMRPSEMMLAVDDGTAHPDVRRYLDACRDESTTASEIYYRTGRAP